MALSLGARVIVRVVLVLSVTMLLLFLTAGTWVYWQGWLLLAVIGGYAAYAFSYFYIHDREFVERRLRGREKLGAQKRLVRILKPLTVVVFALPGLDYRWGWSRGLWGAAPAWLCVAGAGGVLGGLLIVFRTLNVNRYASRTIEVEAGQRVITSGPYALVRHPMYSGSLVMWLVMPLALGSYVTWPAFALLVPFYVIRLLNEEQFLRRELPGYSEYCEKTRYRLVPYVW